MSVRHDWYQSDASVVISVLLKNAQDKHGAVKIEKDRLEVTADDYSLILQLHKDVDPAKSSYKMLASKIEISLAKIEGVRWDSLEKRENLPGPAPSASAAAPQHPGTKKNWDKLAKEEEEKEASELKGEQALQALFQKIYGDSSDEVRKAMNKSYFESGGTVLSTNWQEVGAKKVEVKPPDGTEFKEWKQ